VIVCQLIFPVHWCRLCRTTCGGAVPRRRGSSERERRVRAGLSSQRPTWTHCHMDAPR